MLGAAVLILTLLPIIRRVLVCPIPLTAMAFTVRITEKKKKDRSLVTSNKFDEWLSIFMNL